MPRKNRGRDKSDASAKGFGMPKITSKDNNLRRSTEKMLPQRAQKEPTLLTLISDFWPPEL